MKNNPFKSLSYKNFNIDIYNDSNPENPRNWESLSKMIFFHKKYILGDKHEYKTNDYSGWDELEKGIKSKEDIAIILPVYMYDHSGLTISTKPFSCPYDSGQIGYIIVTKSSIRRWFDVKKITKAILEKAQKNLEIDIKTYDSYLRGDVFGYVIKEGEEEIDSCWGYFGYNVNEDEWEVVRAAKECIDGYKKEG